MLRRLLALPVLIGALYIAAHADRNELGLLWLVVELFAFLIGLLALAVLLFNLRWSHQEPLPDSGFGLSDRVGRGIGSLGILLFAAAPLFIALRGVWRGVMPALGDGTDALFAASPLRFALLLAAWLAFSAVAFWLWWKVRTSPPAEGREAGD
jgi:hypothetical protein